MSLEEIRAELAKLPRNRVPERADWAKLSAGWTKRIRERIAELERLQAASPKCIGCGCLSLDRCQFANPGDRAARQGAGSAGVDESAPLVKSGHSPVACGFARAIIGDEASIPYTVLVKPTVAWEAQRMRCRRRKSISALTT